MVATRGLMEWAKISIQKFFAAKVLVWIIDEDISDLKIHLSPISRVRTFPGPFFTFEFHPIEGVQELWSKSFKWSGRGLNPGPSACQSSIITTIPRSFVVAGPMMWLLWMSTSSIQYSNTSLSPGDNAQTMNCRATAPWLQWGGCVQSGPPTWV